MSFDIQVAKGEKTVRLTCTGEVTLQDFLEYLRDFWIGPHNSGYHHFVDFRNAEICFDFGQVLALASQASPADNLPYSNARTALVVANQEQHDLCEFFMHARHQVCNPFIREVNVFYDAKLADAWLRETRPAIVS